MPSTMPSPDRVPPSPADQPSPADHVAAGQPAGQPLVRIAVWSDDRARILEGTAELPAILADPTARVWVDVSAASHAGVAEIAELLHLHPLIVEDIAERNQRAKVEETDGTLHLVMFWITYEGEVTEVEVDLVLGKRTLLTVHEPAWDPFTLPQLRAGPDAQLRRGVDFLLYALTDGIVDAYFPVLDAIGDEIDALQNDVIRTPTAWTLERLFAIKRELVGLRRAMSPAREIFNQLTNRDLDLVAPEHIIYFRDVYDHLIRVTDELDNDRELAAATLEVYLSTINNNLSVIMKRLTGVTVVFAGVGAIAGIFGMSEAGAAFGGLEAVGFWLVTGTIFAGAALTAVMLRRFGWI